MFASVRTWKILMALAVLLLMAGQSAGQNQVALAPGTTYGAPVVTYETDRRPSPITRPLPLSWYRQPPSLPIAARCCRATAFG
jgi:hypothetical protein